MSLLSPIVLLLSAGAWGTTLCVNPGGTGGCYSSIQSAINAANPGDTVFVEAGTYAEQVIIKKNLTLIGEGNTTVVRPTSIPQLFPRYTGSTPNSAPIIVADSVTNGGVSVKKLRVDASGISSMPGGASGFFGIQYRETDGLIDSVTVDGFLSTIYPALGFYLSGVWNTTTIEVARSNFPDYTKNGITCNGSYVTANVHHNTVTGLGYHTAYAQNGIQLGYGATGTVQNNTVSNHSSGTAWAAVGILIYQGSGDVLNNTVSENQVGIDYEPGSGNVNGNAVTASTGGTGQSSFYGILSAIYYYAPKASRKTAQPFDEEELGKGPMTIYTVSVNNNTVDGDDSPDAWGVTAWVEPPHTLNFTATGNFVTDWGYGFCMYESTTAVLNGIANSNSITSNVLLGVWSNDVGLCDLGTNWWGDNTPIGVASQVSANVDYTPWLDVGTDISGDPGFQGDFSVLWVDDNSPQTGVVGRIQEGIDLVSGSTVNVLAGTYVENIVIDKPVDLLGAGQDSVLVYTDSSDVGPPYGPSFQGSQMVIVQADNVLIDGFTFDGDNPTLTPVGILDARNGIITNYTLGNWDSLTVKNCTVRNIYLRGIYASAQTSINGIEFSHNTVNNVKGVSYQSAGLMFYNGEGFVDSNICTNASLGIFLHAGSYGSVRLNQADSCELGIGVNGNSNSTNLYSNRVTNSDQGIQTIGVNAPVLLAGDSIKNCDYGLVLYGLGTGTTDMQYSSIDGMGASGAIGVYASTDVSPWGVGDVRSYLMRNEIINNWLGIVLSEPLGDTTKNVLVDIGLDPAGYNLIYDNSSFELYLEGCNDDINAAYNYWGKSLFSQIEQEIYHQGDDPALGLVDFSMPYLLGDVNLDRKIDLGDVVYLINYVYKSGPAPYILILGDTNRDDIIDLADVVTLIDCLYRGGAPPAKSPEVTKVVMRKERPASPSPASAPMK